MAECGQTPATFWEMLASTLMKDTDGNVFFNVICYNADCGDLSPALECGMPTNDLQGFIVGNGFDVDSCGLPAIKLRVCVDGDAENR